ncbi:hypothetical protein ALI22I_08680 [Saccharothrix sp. ALI-22-I]|uniref:hypothetical protein n=1 Tax=Saccharothrix sp. ALI-22-I TaxID=1933778 RepID=UPI00097CA2BF|nr:hypothetical protein [Saccharothrix sp. ALI-22-I]ONI91425.1 hypothetical protein ALI22I_08680 [Saccharothrix sp. ALI-22-I]
MTSHYRDERAAKRRPPLVPVLSQHVDEGYRLVTPAGALTPVVEHVQWVDNHTAGPNTHAVISFADGTDVEFPFDVPLTAVWHAEQRPVDQDQLDSAAPAAWGAEL